MEEETKTAKGKEEVKSQSVKTENDRDLFSWAKVKDVAGAIKGPHKEQQAAT